MNSGLLSLTLVEALALRLAEHELAVTTDVRTGQGQGYRSFAEQFLLKALAEIFSKGPLILVELRWSVLRRDLFLRPSCIHGLT